MYTSATLFPPIDESELNMRLTDLTAYADRKYHIKEQSRWYDQPGFSVLSDPGTSKWIAFLMSLYDPESGGTIEYCDIKCGQDCLREFNAPYLSKPYRMVGRRWVGVRIDEHTDREIVFKLLDRSITPVERRGFTLVLNDSRGDSRYTDTPLGIPIREKEPAEDIPEKIAEMRQLYDFGDGSFRQKCRNFLIQGRFMEDYEDDYPWRGEFTHYFPTYHDLRPDQLRGYFTWRTMYRRGEYERTSTSFAYIYLYELLNCIGTSSPADSLDRMQGFIENYIESGLGERSILRNLYRWMLEFSVLKGMVPEIARRYSDPDVVSRDEAIAVLRNPDGKDDDAVIGALCRFAGDKFTSSPVFGHEDGKHLFAESWRYAVRECQYKGKDLITLCFGHQVENRWHPLSNAIYFEDEHREPVTYGLNDCHSFIFRNGAWYERSYLTNYYDKATLMAFIHETERMLRLYLKTGSKLKEKEDERWATRFVKKAIEHDAKDKEEAKRPKVNLDLTGLDRIRDDSALVRESLLTDEEKGDDLVAYKNECEEELEISDAPVVSDIPLDGYERDIIFALLKGESVREILEAKRAMPEIIADSINEAFFDEIGDSVVECIGKDITLIEDYREDIIRIMGGIPE